MEYIEIDKDEIPYRFTIDLSGEEFELEINYNNRFDFFTVDILKDKKPLVVGEKLVLDRPLFADMADVKLPKVTIVPKDRSKTESRITYDNLEKTVFLFVFDLDVI